MIHRLTNLTEGIFPKITDRNKQKEQANCF